MPKAARAVQAACRHTEVVISHAGRVSVGPHANRIALYPGLAREVYRSAHKLHTNSKRKRPGATLSVQETPAAR
jgi:hypothetical protein